jgi:hypothetical protein
MIRPRALVASCGREWRGRASNRHATHPDPDRSRLRSRLAGAVSSRRTCASCRTRRRHSSPVPNRAGASRARYPGLARGSGRPDGRGRPGRHGWPPDRRRHRVRSPDGCPESRAPGPAAGSPRWTGPDDRSNSRCFAARADRRCRDGLHAGRQPARYAAARHPDPAPGDHRPAAGDPVRAVAQLRFSRGAGHTAPRHQPVAAPPRGGIGLGDAARRQTRGRRQRGRLRRHRPRDRDRRQPRRAGLPAGASVGRSTAHRHHGPKLLRCLPAAGGGRDAGGRLRVHQQLGPHVVRTADRV